MPPAQETAANGCGGNYNCTHTRWANVQLCEKGMVYVVGDSHTYAYCLASLSCLAE